MFTMADLAAAGKALVATNFDDHHEQIACKLFNKIDKGTFGNATELTLNDFRTLSYGEKVHGKTLLAALASTYWVDKIDIDEIDAVKALMTDREAAWACSPLFVIEVKAACDAHSDARFGVLLGGTPSTRLHYDRTASDVVRASRRPYVIDDGLHRRPSARSSRRPC